MSTHRLSLVLSPPPSPPSSMTWILLAGTSLVLLLAVVGLALQGCSEDAARSVQFAGADVRGVAQLRRAGEPVSVDLGAKHNAGDNDEGPTVELEAWEIDITVLTYVNGLPVPGRVTVDQDGCVRGNLAGVQGVWGKCPIEVVPPPEVAPASGTFRDPSDGL